MEITKGRKTEWQLNNEQSTACLKAAGAARFAYGGTECMVIFLMSIVAYPHHPLPEREL